MVPVLALVVMSQSLNIHLFACETHIRFLVSNKRLRFNEGVYANEKQTGGKNAGCLKVYSHYTLQ